MEKENNYCVYMHTNKINQKKYIGLTKQSVERRWRNGGGYKECTHFWNAIQKYGWYNFEHTVIQDKLSKEEAAELEKQLIAQYNTMDQNYGYNIAEGGFAPTLSPETKAKLSAINSGSNHPKFGKKDNLETRQRKSKALMGYSVSEEIRERIRLGVCGEKNVHLGTTTPPEVKEKQRAASPNNKAVICLNIMVEYRSMMEASRQTKCDQGSISRCVHNLKDSANGLAWCLASEYTEELKNIKLSKISKQK